MFLRYRDFAPHLAKKVRNLNIGVLISLFSLWSPWWPPLGAAGNSALSLWSPWCNVRSCCKLRSVPLGNMDYRRERDLVPRMLAGLMLPPAKHTSISQLLWGSQSIYLPLSLAFPTGSQAWQFRPFLVLQPFWTSSLLPKCFISSISPLSAYCLLPEPSVSAFAGPFASWAFPTGFVLHHSALKSSTHTRNSESCSVSLFLPHTELL